MSNVYRAPITYSVPSTTPIHIAGSKDPPVRIINTAVTGTVWLSDNPGLQAGQGTPLHPGTSLQWTRPTELFAIADSGLTVDIILTTEVDDWQPDPAAIAAAVLNAGVLVIDNPQTIMQVAVNGPGSTSEADIGRYQSLNISIILATDNPVTPTDNRLQLLFTDGGTTTYIVHLYFAVQGQLWTAAVPCYGDGFSVSVLTDSTFNVFVSGSHRSIQTIRQRIDEVDATGLTVSAGTSVFFDDLNLAGGRPVGDAIITTLPPWYGTIQVNVRWTAPAVAAANFDLLIGNQINPGAFNATQQINGVIIQGVPPAAHTYQCTANLVTAGESLQITTRNGYAAAGLSYSCRIVPVTGALVA
jgi:hypothetical protein